ncbi:MAG TPA: hypothetical protein VLD58_00095, partial [Gemmatimonadales bacterium]|nr:hypothetical protein [Gemmatimonadales bacterium]
VAQEGRQEDASLPVEVDLGSAREHESLEAPGGLVRDGQGRDLRREPTPPVRFRGREPSDDVSWSPGAHDRGEPTAAAGSAGAPSTGA